MGLSLDFWLELIAIAACFALVIIWIPKYRAYSLNKLKAVNLRVRISETIKLSLPAIAATSMQTIDATGKLVLDSRALHFYSRQLQNHRSEAHVLYEDELKRVQKFIDKFTLLIQEYDGGRLGSGDAEDLLLLGERILLDLKENGLLSTVKR